MRILLALALAACSAPAIAAKTLAQDRQALPLSRVLGGPLRDPVMAAPYVYIPSGRIVSTWNYADESAPLYVGATAQPAKGQITGLARWQDYLYASWTTGDVSAGIAVYWLADPANPVLIGEFEDYVTSSFKRIWAIAAMNGHLYFFDQENGLFWADLASDPLHPASFGQSPWPTGGFYFDGAYAQGDRLYASGSLGFASVNFHFCDSYDLSTPSAPVREGSCGGGSYPTYFRTRVQPPYAVTFGLENLALTDISDPAHGVPLGRSEAVSAMDGFLSGDHAYALGIVGIDIFDISDRMNPNLIAHSPVSMLGVGSVTALDDGALVLTSTDRFVRLDVSTPSAPQIRSEVAPPGGIAAGDIALVNGKAVLLQQNYGLGIAEPATLAPLARFEADLPEDIAARRVGDFAVEGDLAYLAAASYGVFIVDLSDPMRPAESGRFAVPEGANDFANLSIAVEDRLVYLTRKMFQGSFLRIVDASDPAAPVTLSTIEVGGIDRLQVRDGYVYAAGDSGLQIFDVRDPAAPVEVGRYEECPGIASDTHPVYDVDLAEAGARAYLACLNSLHVIDVGDPTQPRRLGAYQAPDYASSGFSVAAYGNRAWYGDRSGVHELDVGDASAPALLGVTATGEWHPFRLRALADGRLFAFSTIGGVHEFGAVVADSIFRDGFDAGSRP